MKQKLLFLIVMLAFLLPARLSAFEYTYEGVVLTYEIIDEGAKTCKVSRNSYSNISGELVIPEIANDGTTDYAVTSIGEWAFKDCSGLTSVNIPDAVTSIGKWAFSGCSSLTSVNIPDAVTSIGEDAFSGCSGLTSVNIPDAVTSIGNSAFSYSGLTSVVIPNSVTSIGYMAFYRCYSLTSVKMGDSVTSIEGYAFGDCDSLTKAEFESIESYFNIKYGNREANPLTYTHHLYIDGKEVTELKIPDTCTSISERAFSDWSGLTSVEIPNSVTTIEDYAFYGCSGLTSVEIPNSVTSIGGYAFSNCSSLISVNIGNSVTSIGKSAFYDCGALTSVEIGNSVKEIGNRAFNSCISLTSIELPNSVTSIGDYAFEGCLRLTSFEIPSSVTSIGDGAFSVCRGLTSVKIGDSVTSIGNSAFNTCSGLTSVKIGNSVTSIGNCAFNDCSSLISIELPNSVTSIGEQAFVHCPLKSLVIPNSVTSIGGSAFYCETLKIFIIQSDKVVFASDIFANPVSSNRLSIYVFAPVGLDCSILDRNVTTFDPETTVFLDDHTILSDSGKTLFFAPIYKGVSYEIPEGVTRILSDSFCAMEHSLTLGSITIPSSIIEIEPDAFKNTHIDKVNFTDWTKWYANVKLGNLYSNPYWNSTPYVGGVQMVTPELQEGITEIPDYINYGLQFKNEIELPRSIKRIGAYAFYNNKELFSVILPKGLEEIGESAFDGCSLLENPSFPTGLKKIEDGAYRNCTSISEIVLPEGVSFLGSNTHETTDEWLNTGLLGNYGSKATIKGIFEGCSALEKAVVTVDVDYIADNMFKNCNALDKIYLPLQLKSIGISAFESCNTLEEITFPSTLESIGDRAFRSGKISKLIIPDAVNYIGPYAFSDQRITNLSLGKGIQCISTQAFMGNNIKIVNFSDGLKEIGPYAFADCGYIGSVILPSTVTHIGNRAFNNTSIGHLVIPDEVESLSSGSCGNPSILTLGSYIKNIDADAFGFEKLYTIRLKAHMPPALSGAFPLTSEQNDQLTLIVNKGRHDTYNTNARWKQIDRILEAGDTEVEIYLDGEYSLAEEIRIQSGLMPSCVTKMMVDGPLSDNDLRVIKENMISLTSLDLSNVTNLIALPDKQFEGSLLTNVVLPSNLEYIGNYAFRDCRLLELTELPNAVKSIGREAFSSCPSVNLKALPTALENIGEYAFSGTGMIEIVGGELLKEVGRYAFQNCKLLERADLGVTSLTEIADNVFEGCSELDEVILPSAVDRIGSYAFSGTALRNIDFAAGVTNIGYNAFSNNRRLVSATLPESLTDVGSNLFENCPRLISLSMPQGTISVGTNVVKNDRKLANLSCSAPESPESATGAFDNVRFRYVTLTIPTLSYRKYLSAAQWGKFESTQNRIKVTINKGVTVTSAAEKEYQDMLTEDELEAAQDAAAAQNGKMSSTRKMRRAAARENTIQNFASLFDGAQLMPGKDGGVNRIFITPMEGVNVTSILFDGEELISSFDGYSILLPEGKSGDLEIITDAKPTVVESILLSNKELTLTASETAKLTATVQPADTEDKTVTWSSSDESVAVVDDNGEVTVTGVGKAMITASCGNVSSECIVKCYPQTGDANWNGNITITDAVDISNYIVKKKTAPEGWDVDEWTEFYVAGANANESEDGKITIADASATVRLALAQPDASNARSRIRTNENMDGSVDALVIESLSKTADGNMSVAITLDGSKEYVALQADIILPEGMNIDVKAGQGAICHSLETMKFDDNHIRVALFNFGNKALASDNTPILEIITDSDLASADEIMISNILASDGDANEYALVARASGMTGVENVESGDISIKKDSGCVIVSNAIGKKVEIYTMEGQLVKSFIAEDATETISLSSGLYVVKAGDKTLKVVL